jgi:hypothetical protein
MQKHHDSIDKVPEITVNDDIFGRLLGRSMDSINYVVVMPPIVI